ncbi:sirohydrochlorin chelatase [Paenibacillus spongiae]|uniref:Cobalamin biosynthesis protein CbiX n=1 Tax=Paenibacillus spongiae TaxID=2909671 RepID=A0ABY5SB12_9BACL|nr:CbiX/SirB N-terminal domain-containing protein [Paenibacillus spongiae]UVI30934.1 cobalamin biosynthesis protein CbiX [Paenibacillus spongiae]
MKPGILVISHGSREAGWVQLVDDAVKTAAALLESRFTIGVSETVQPAAAGSRSSAGDGTELPEGAPVPVVSAFLEIVEGRLIQDGIDQLEAEGVTELYVLPLFVSSGSTHVDDIGQAFGLPPVTGEREGELARFRVAADMRVHVGQPIDDDPDIAELLLSNIRELSAEPEREMLLLIAHGSREAVFHERWRRGMKRLAERMKTLGGFARADIAMLLPNQAACKLGALQKKRQDKEVIVVPLFLSSGYFTQTVIPKRLEGFTYRYNGRAMLPHPIVARWMVKQIRRWLDRLGAHRLGTSG